MRAAEPSIQTIRGARTSGLSAAHALQRVNIWLGSAARALTSFLRSRFLVQYVNLGSLLVNLGSLLGVPWVSPQLKGPSSG